MAFIESPRFPEDISYGSSGGPAYLTDVTFTDSGDENRNQNWINSRATWDAIHGIKTHVQMAAVRSFFHTARGRFKGFRFKDWFDYQATDAPALLITGLTLQMYKRYTSGSYTTDRKIKKPVSGTVVVKKNGTTLTLTTDYTIDYTTGIITAVASFSGGDSFTWTGEFDVPVRFDTDKFTSVYDTYGTESWDSIPLIELRNT